MQRELTPQEAVEEQVKAIARAWWVLALVGLASLVAGGILVAKPSRSLATLAVVMGIFLLLDGIAELISSFGPDVANRGLAAIIGVLGIIVGIVLVRHPTHAVSAIGLLIGIWLVAAGVVRLVRVMVIGGHVVLRLVISILEIAAGVAVVSDPHIGYATLAVLLGIWLIVNGISSILLSLAIRTAKAELIADPLAASHSSG